MYHPSREEFARAAGQGNLIPVHRELLADGDTPVSAYAALGWETPSFDLFPRADDFCDGSSCGEISFACNSFGACCAEDLYCDLYGMPPDAQAIADERNFQKGVGVFLKGTEHGFRGLDFQARLECLGGRRLVSCFGFHEVACYLCVHDLVLSRPIRSRSCAWRRPALLSR